MGPPPATFMQRQYNSCHCGVFVYLHAAYIAIQQPFTFTQADIDDVRMWMVHLVDEEGKKQNGGYRQKRSESLSDFEHGLGYQQQETEGQGQHAANTDRHRLPLKDLLTRSTQLSDIHTVHKNQTGDQDSQVYMNIQHCTQRKKIHKCLAQQACILNTRSNEDKR